MDNLKDKELDIYRVFVNEDDYGLICRRIAQIIGNPIYVFDSSYALLVSSDEIVDEAYLEKLNADKKTLLFDGDDSLLSSGEITRIGNSDGVFVKKFNDLEYPVMTRRIHDGTNLLGYASVYGRNKEFDADDERLLETICRIASKDLSIRKYTDRSSSYILQKVIDGKYIDKKELDRIFKDLGLYSNHYRLICVRSNNNQFIYETLFSKHPDGVVITYRKDVVLIVEGQYIDEKLIEKRVNELNNKVKIKVAISDDFNFPSSLQDAYKQTDKLLLIGESIDSDKLIYKYEDYKMELLLSIIDKNILERAVDIRVKDIILYDNKSETNYINDLRTFFKANRNIGRAANYLFIHKNSMYYRLGKIGQKFKIDFEDERDCFLVEVSLKILDFLESVQDD